MIFNIPVQLYVSQKLYLKKFIGNTGYAGVV